MRRFDPSLYLVTSSVPLELLLKVVEQAVDGGVTLVQLREKNLPPAEILDRARHLKRLLQPRSIPLLLNDSPELARQAEADGVHLGQGDGSPARARAILGKKAIIGLSLETLLDAERFVDAPWAAEVDYVVASPVFSTASKWDIKPPLLVTGLRKMRALVRQPLIAIGGITAENVAEVIQHGADGVAVISAIFSSPDPRAAAQGLAKEFQHARRMPRD